MPFEGGGTHSWQREVDDPVACTRKRLPKLSRHCYIEGSNAAMLEVRETVCGLCWVNLRVVLGDLVGGYGGDG